jgi:hypothetical protein
MFLSRFRKGVFEFRKMGIGFEGSGLQVVRVALQVFF